MRLNKLLHLRKQVPAIQVVTLQRSCEQPCRGTNTGRNRRDAPCALESPNGICLACASHENRRKRLECEICHHNRQGKLGQLITTPCRTWQPIDPFKVGQIDVGICHRHTSQLIVSRGHEPCRRAIASASLRVSKWGVSLLRNSHFWLVLQASQRETNHCGAPHFERSPTCAMVKSHAFCVSHPELRQSTFAHSASGCASGAQSCPSWPFNFHLTVNLTWSPSKVVGGQTPV